MSAEQTNEFRLPIAIDVVVLLAVFLVVVVVVVVVVVLVGVFNGNIWLVQLKSNIDCKWHRVDIFKFLSFKWLSFCGASTGTATTTATATTTGSAHCAGAKLGRLHAI